VACELTPRQYRWQRAHYFNFAEPLGVCIDQVCISRALCAERCMVESAPDLQRRVEEQQARCAALPPERREACASGIGAIGTKEQVVGSTAVLRCMAMQCGFAPTEPVP
jgi:hypothetical protein